MTKRTRTVLVASITLIMAFILAACSNGNASSSAQQQEDSAAATQSASREEVEAVLTKAAESKYKNVSFTNKVETTATAAAANGAAQSQTIRTTTSGELDQSGDKPKLHMKYQAQSNVELGKTEYEMFIDDQHLIVNQKEQLYVDAMNEETLNSYASSITSLLSADEIGAILDMAGGFKMEASGDDTVVTVTVDKDKLAESAKVDDSSLPETTQIATMVVSYTIDSDDHFKAVRLMSSTTGTPTYRVNQTYQFSKYDETALPEWPDLNAYIAQQSGIMTDENGRMYIVGDDGQRYYVTNIGDDGTIYYDTGNTGTPTYTESGGQPTQSGGETTTVSGGSTSGSDTTGGSTTGGSTAGGNTTGGGSTTGGTDSDKGRAYITAADGTIHYLDEPGSEIRDLGGATVFIDANGEWYFLDFGDGENN